MSFSSHHSRRWRVVPALALLGLAAPACVETPATPGGGVVPMGTSDFVSAPPGGQSGAVSDNATAGAADAGASAPPAAGGDRSPTTTPRAVEETDLSRLDGDRLYYLNGYRGLLVFDVSNVDAPRLLGRAPLFGTPVEMVVRGGVAYAIVADWYGRDAAGRPFHGSVVRAIDARDPAHITIASETALRGWVRDARVVGDVLYTVSEDYGWASPYDDAPPNTPVGPSVVVSAVNIAESGRVRTTGERVWAGYSGVFNVTADAILMAHAASNPDGSWNGSTSQVDYVDISDPAGAIRTRGTVQIEGQVQGWGANNGRFNIDFDGRYVRALSMRYDNGASGNSYRLTTVDARDPDALAVTSRFDVNGTGWIPAARFDRGRMYLSPSDSYYYGGGGARTTPVQIYDVSDPAAPRLAGQTAITGSVWNFIPAGDRLFALGNDSADGTYTSSQIALRYLDVTDPAAPRVIGTSAFGQGWAWTPAAGDFKAFTMDATRGLVVLPYSGWDNRGAQYNNGLQLVEFSRDAIATSGTARTRGWTERGIFVGNRLVSLSDLSLSVVDYSDRRAPRLVNEVTLARNVIAAQPMGDALVQVSSDWWGNETHSTVRVLPITDPDDDRGAAPLAELRIEGTNARVFRNGAMAYVVTTARSEVACPTDGSGGYYPGVPREDGTPTCYAYAPQVTVVDLTVPASARLRGTVRLPTPEGYYGYGYDGWGGWYGWYGWWDGETMVQAGGDVLAYREYLPRYVRDADGTSRRTDTSLLRVIDLANPDAPRLSSTTVSPTRDGWWGNLRAVGSTLYASHYDYVDRGGRYPGVRYYVDRIDLSDRAAPRVLSRVNVPGLLVGASADQRYLYTVDYRWFDYGGDVGSRARNTFNVLELAAGRAYLRSTVDVDGYLGNVFVRGSRAYFSAERYDATTPGYGAPTVQLHALDLSNPAAPVDRAGAAQRGWGWLLGVEGDRALVQSGWGAGVDVYRLTDERAPELLSFQRTRGWWGSNLARQGDTMYLATGYWGTQTIDLGR
jgi:hypothetical protein